MASSPARPRSNLRIALGFLARIGVTALVFGYLFSRIDAHAVAASLEHIPAIALLGCLAALVLAVFTGLVRWRALLDAYGATTRPSWGESTRLYLIAMFYNLLPGAVGGDVLRGYATRHYFADGGATRSVGVVFVERVFGFAGLLILTALATLVSPLGDREVLAYSALGLCAAFGAVVAIAVSRRLTHIVPARLGKLLSALPVIQRPGPFAFALALSVSTHVAVSWAGHVIVQSLAPSVTLANSMAIFPLGTLAAYFPLTVAGAGARDTALVVLFSKLGVPRADALATSLCLLACTLLVAGLGGLVQLRGRLPDAGTESGGSGAGRTTPTKG